MLEKVFLFYKYIHFYLMMNFIPCFVRSYPLDWHDFSPTYIHCLIYLTAIVHEIVDGYICFYCSACFYCTLSEMTKIKMSNQYGHTFIVDKTLV